MNKLKLIAQRAKQDKKLKFTSLAHHINAESLAEYYKLLKRDKACGIDGVTIEEYGSNLQNNITQLVDQLKAKKYKAVPVRRTFIPKATSKELRPLGIPATQDKLVQMALKTIVECIFEPMFLDCSHGFRPNKGCHTALRQLDNVMKNKPINYIVEVDIRKFFDTVDHAWLMRCLRERIVDPNLLRLIEIQLKAGVMEATTLHETNEGTPQGGIISPLLANIYLHYVLDLWFEKKFKLSAKGYTELIRYCDDFVVVCELKSDAEMFLSIAQERLAKFNLKFAMEKTRIAETGKQAWWRKRYKGIKPDTITFLGFTMYLKATRTGWFRVQFKTAKTNLSRKLKKFKEWLQNLGNQISLEYAWKGIKSRINGHYNYFGVNGNMYSLRKYYHCCIWMIFEWINRRSQRKSMNYKQFNKYLNQNPLPTPSVKVQIWNS